MKLKDVHGAAVVAAVMATGTESEAILMKIANLTEVDEIGLIADAVAQRLVVPVQTQAAFISVDDAAVLLGITREAIDKRIQRRQVPGVVRTAGRRVQIDREKMLAGLARRTR